MTKKILFPLLFVFIFFTGVVGLFFEYDARLTKSKKFKVVTTFTVIADIAKNVAGEAAIVESITKPGAEIHDYQPTPKDIIRAKGAHLILWNGMNLERWFEKFMLDIGRIPSVVVSNGVTPLSIYEGPYTGKPNPHAWMSPKNALIYIENIRIALIKYDPKNAEKYTKNAADYSKKIMSLQEKLAQTIATIPTKQRVLVTSEGAFSYLAKDLGMDEVYIWPMNADHQGTPKQVKQVIDAVNQANIPVVFSESTVSDKPAKQIAAETGAIYGGILYVDSLSNASGPVPTYIDMLDITTSTIANAFELALQSTPL